MNRRFTGKFWIGFSAMIALLFTSCLSYNYTGVSSATDKLPDQSIIGMSRQQLIDTYGLPERVIPLESGEEAGNGMPFQGSPFSENGIFVYRERSEYRILLYERTRGHSYAVRLNDGKVTEVKTTVIAKGDGLSFNANMMPAGPAGK